MAGKKVFICAAVEDAGYYSELITALNAWEVRHTELGVVPNPVTSMPPAIEAAIRDCEVFLRVCTTYTRQSNAVKLATDFFQTLLEKDPLGATAAPQAGQPHPRSRLSARRRGEEDALHHGARQVARALAGGAGRLGRRGHADPATQSTSALRHGRGAAVAVASAGVAGTLLVRQFQSQQPPRCRCRRVSQATPGSTSASSRADRKTCVRSVRGYFRMARPSTRSRFSRLSHSDGKRTSVVPDATVYILSTTTGKKRRFASRHARLRTNCRASLLARRVAILLSMTQRPHSANRTEPDDHPEGGTRQRRQADLAR